MRAKKYLFTCIFQSIYEMFSFIILVSDLKYIHKIFFCGAFRWSVTKVVLLLALSL
jgi:hypothetical protein